MSRNEQEMGQCFLDVLKPAPGKRKAHGFRQEVKVEWMAVRIVLHACETLALCLRIL